MNGRQKHDLALEESKIVTHTFHLSFTAHGNLLDRDLYLRRVLRFFGVALRRRRRNKECEECHE
jgi:hypothetical protein